MGGLFYWLLNMSIVATVTGIVVVLLRLIPKLPRRFIVILWAIPLIRFLIPFGLGGKYGLMAFLSQFTTRTVTVYKDGVLEFSVTNSIMAADSYSPMTYKVDLLEGVFRYASLVWAVVAVALLIVMAVLYVTTINELKSAVLLHDNVYCSDKIVSPAVYGVFRPRIIIPASYKDSADLDLIISHETRHIRRLDNLWRVIAFLTAAIHWFNPFVWLFLKMFLSDTELACDESVLARLGAGERKRYAHALIDARQSRTVFASSFGGARLRTRVEHIISFRKMTAFSAALLGVLAVVIAYILLTNAA